METVSNILTHLRKKGFRITENRTNLLRLLCETKRPISADKIIEAMRIRYGRAVHKVTVYRELDFFHKQGVIHEVVFGDRKKRYELAYRPHHHHLVCTKCHSVEDVQMSDDLARVEKRIQLQKGFDVSYHSLEFFGLCQSCK